MAVLPMPKVIDPSSAFKDHQVDSVSGTGVKAQHVNDIDAGELGDGAVIHP